MIVLLAGAGLVGPLASCGDSGSDEPSSDGSAGSGASGARGATSAGEAAVGEAGDDTIVVDMDEYEFFGVPEALPAGETVLRVRNVGFEEHNFEIHRGDSMVREFPLPLNPGQTRDMEIDLEPGEYVVLCTVSGHDGRGMREELSVTAP